MNIHTWNKSSRSKSVRLGQNYAQREYDSPSKWLVFWRIITKQKKKKKNSDPTFYDPNTYMQNFDEGSGRVEPDNLYRSFSARYADPSRISCRMNSMKWRVDLKKNLFLVALDSLEETRALLMVTRLIPLMGVSSNQYYLRLAACMVGSWICVNGTWCQQEHLCTLNYDLSLVLFISCFFPPSQPIKFVHLLYNQICCSELKICGNRERIITKFNPQERD